MAANIDPVAQSCFEEVVAALDLPNDVKTRATEVKKRACGSVPGGGYFTSLRELP